MSWHDTNAMAAAACGIAPSCICTVWRRPDQHCPVHEPQQPPMTSLTFVAKALGYPQPRKEGGK
jgi:hypothetical protein